MRTLEATIDEKGGVHLCEPIALTLPRRALVTIMDDEPPLPNVDIQRKRSVKKKNLAAFFLESPLADSGIDTKRMKGSFRKVAIQ